MPLVYSFVARGTTVLAEYSPFTGNFNQVAVECLTKLPNPESKFTITCDGHTFNFRAQDGYTYLVVADEGYGRQIPFAYLDRIREEFEQKHAEAARDAPELSLNTVFGPRIRFHMEYVTAHPEEISKIAAVQKKVSAVRDVMVDNIDKVLERGDRLDTLNTKAGELESQANMFQKKSKQLRNKMWMQNMRLKIIIFFVILLLIGGAIGSMCMSTPICGLNL